MKLSPKSFLLFVTTALVLAACTPASGSRRGFAFIWYVSLDGNDGNTCDDPSRPCLTVQAAFDKARHTSELVADDYPGETVSFYHTVNVAAGTYMISGPVDGYRFVSADFDVSLVGAGQGSTIFDAGDLYGGIFIDGNVNVHLRNFSLRNVNSEAPDSCVNIRGAAEVEIENVTLSHCMRSGIAHFSSGDLTLTNVTSTGNLIDAGGNGNGLSTAGHVTIEGGSFSGNQGPGISIVAPGGVVVAHGTRVADNQRDGIVVRDTAATLSDMQIVNNGLEGDSRAGLLLIGASSASVTNSHIDNNQFGVWVQDGRASVIGSVVSGNARSGVQVDSGQLRLTDTTLDNNGAYFVGTSLVAGMEVGVGARADLRGVQITGNQNGGISNYGNLILTESSLTGSLGNPPALLNQTGGTALVQRSLIANNHGGGSVVEGGVAVLNQGSMTLINTTISGNQGTGLVNNSPLTVSFSTIAHNAETGFVASEGASAPANLSNNLIAGNTVDCYIPSRSAVAPVLSGSNIDSDDSCGFPETAALADLHLDDLAENGGPTMTHALLAGSPAIDASTGSCPSEDQRVVSRPFGPACDVGAYEAGGAALSLEDGGLEPATVTPTSDKPMLTITVDTGCYFGPGQSWGTASFLPAGTHALIVGQGYGGGWMVILHPNKNVNCWVEQSHTKFDVPLDTLRLITIPDKPTATPEPSKEQREPTEACPTQINNAGVCQ